MDKYASLDPTQLTANMVTTQLAPVDLGGINWHGWEIQYTKSYDTGKKDKQTGEEIVGQKIDPSQGVIYDPITSLIKGGKSSNAASQAIASILVNNAHLNVVVSQLMTQVAQLKVQAAGANKAAAPAK